MMFEAYTSIKYCFKMSLRFLFVKFVFACHNYDKKKGAGQIVPRRNSTSSFLHMRTNSTPSICTCGQIVPHGFSHADKQYPVFSHRRTNSTPSVGIHGTWTVPILHDPLSFSNCSVLG